MHEIAEAVVATYCELDSSHCASFGVYSENGVHTQISGGDVCHADMRQWPANLYDHLITAYPTNMYDNVSLDVWLRFFDFMQNVLYRKWKDQIHLEQGDGEYYIHVSDLDKIPANVLFNLCICSRAPIEKPEAILNWVKLCDEGLHPAIAFSLCQTHDMFMLNGADKKVYGLGLGNHHWPFDTTVGLSALVSGETATHSVSYKEYPAGCTPTNIIWGKTKDLQPVVGSTISDFWTKWKAEHEDILLAS